MNLIHEFTLYATLEDPMPIGEVPTGTRIFFGVKDGHIKGERINAKLHGGGEWALLGPDGFIRIDVRLQAETDDGAFFYAQYSGLLEFSDAVQAALGGGESTDFESTYFYINPRIETGDERYAWLNTTFFIGEGRVLSGGGVEYRVSRPEG
jgi:hypothetical protein